MRFWKSEGSVAEALEPFCRELVRQVRARDSYGLLDGRPDGELLTPFIIDKAKAREIPIVGDPEPQVLARIDQFYAAVALAIEKRCGVMAAPLIAINHEGFGRVVLTCGRLVALSKSLRDVHRFGFPSLEKLEQAGAAMVQGAIALIDKFNEAATAD